MRRGEQDQDRDAPEQAWARAGVTSWEARLPRAGARLVLGAAPETRLGAVWRTLGALLAHEVDDRRGFLFLPVAFGLGIALYLGAAHEPAVAAGPLSLLVLLGLAVACRSRPLAFYLLAGLATVAAGFSTASLQVARIAHPVLSAPRDGVTVSGLVEAVEARPRGSRITLAVSGLEPKPDPAPQRVRLSLGGGAPPALGSEVTVRANLAPPPGPAYPGGFDFGRAAWFEGIGATGFAVGRVNVTPATAPAGLGLRLAAGLEASRQAMAARIRAAVPGEAGEVAVALVTGLRGGVPADLEEAMRVSGLSHVLSISGLHMALVATTVFILARLLLTLLPGLALRRPVKAWAAVPALAAATYYLMLAGPELATQRSYIMTLLVLIGVMVGRPAFTARTLALAALVVMALAPWALLDPGAQMSFAATLALVVSYDRGGRQVLMLARRAPGFAGRALHYGLALVMTSLAAGLATAPYAAFHFQRLAPLSLIANMAAMPLSSFIIMPAGLFGALLMPFGWDGPCWQVMGWGIDGMSAVARFVAALPGADGGLRALPLASLILLTLALLCFCLLRTRLVLVSPVLAALALLPMATAERPDVLIDAQGRTVAVRGPDGQMALMGDRSRGLAERFSAAQWLAAEGRRGAEDVALGRCDEAGCTLPLAGGGLVAYPLSRAALAEDCRRATLIITRFAPPAECAAELVRLPRTGMGSSLALIRQPDTQLRALPPPPPDDSGDAVETEDGWSDGTASRRSYDGEDADTAARPDAAAGPSDPVHLAQTGAPAPMPRVAGGDGSHWRRVPSRSAGGDRPWLPVAAATAQPAQ